MASSIHPLDSQSSQVSSALSSTYSEIESWSLQRDAKTLLEKYQPQDPKDDTVAVLRAFIEHLPSDGKKQLIANMLGCAHDAERRQLSLSFVKGLLYLLKDRCKTLITLSPRLGRAASVEALCSEITESGTRNQQSKLKNACLSRDGNRCVLTGDHEEKFIDPLLDDVPVTTTD